MERRVEFMILEFVGRVLLNVLKAMVWMALLMLRCVLGLAKLTLLVFGDRKSTRLNSSHSV